MTSADTDFKVTFGAGNVLAKDIDYTVLIDRQNIKVALTEQGIAKIASETSLEERKASEGLGEDIRDVKDNTKEKPFIQVEFHAKLNSSVKLGKPVNNETTITYSNRSGKIQVLNQTRLLLQTNQIIQTNLRKQNLIRRL